MDIYARGKVTVIACKRFGVRKPHAISALLSPTSTMVSASKPQTGRDLVLPTLDVFIQALNIAKDVCGIPPAQIALGSASTLLTMIRVGFPCSAK